MSPILLHIPHSSLEIPADLRSHFILTEDDLQTELLKLTDRYTDELFDVPNADRLVFPVSRLVVDPERFREDENERMASRGMGAVYIKTHDGRQLKTAENREALLQRFYDPHHEALSRWSEAAVEKYGRALIIDCHSFPSHPLPCDLDQTTPRPEICLGSDAFHTPFELLNQMRNAFESKFSSVAINRPYAGSIVPLWAYEQEPRVTSIMIEIRRDLYMDELTGAKSDHFDEVRGRIGTAITSALSQVRS